MFSWYALCVTACEAVFLGIWFIVGVGRRGEAPPLDIGVRIQILQNLLRTFVRVGPLAHFGDIASLGCFVPPERLVMGAQDTVPL